ncbi:ABC transporter substrate-binding protein [Kribbella pittospori]|uniref:ABC transporter substrate-binding protein n=1 Tax=Kribbella pittospori TaxID=722689 RepID=UPI00192E28E3|nr:ABC transporter substrate-binding protein [Kribbella pittospori]
MDRRGFLKLSLATGLSAAAVAGCSGGSGGPSGDGGNVTLRYAWWGNNIRQQNYTKALKQFSTANPSIAIEPEFAEYTAFQERMTTQIAARDVPDIFWIASPQVMTYHKSKLYRKLDDIPTLKWDDYSKEDQETFKLAGELNTLPFAIFTPVIRYNETVTKADGVTIPAEGPGWTWDRLAELLVAYSKNNPGKRKGTPYAPDHDLTFEAWLRQRGEQLWTQDGQAGFTVDGLASWLDWWEKLRKAGGALSLSEQEGMGPDWAQVGKKVLVNFGNSNHIIDDAKMFPKEKFRLRGGPDRTDRGGRAQVPVLPADGDLPADRRRQPRGGRQGPRLQRQQSGDAEDRPADDGRADEPEGGRAGEGVRQPGREGDARGRREGASRRAQAAVRGTARIEHLADDDDADLRGDRARQDERPGRREEVAR